MWTVNIYRLSEKRATPPKAISPWFFLRLKVHLLELLLVIIGFLFSVHGQHSRPTAATRSTTRERLHTGLSSQHELCSLYLLPASKSKCGKQSSRGDSGVENDCEKRATAFSAWGSPCFADLPWTQAVVFADPCAWFVYAASADQAGEMKNTHFCSKFMILFFRHFSVLKCWYDIWYIKIARKVTAQVNCHGSL